MASYTSNSNKSKTKKIQKVVTSKVGVKKKSPISKLAGDLIVEDVKSVIAHVASDVLIPAFKRILVDTVETSVHRMVYGDSGPSRSSGTRVYTNYSSYSSSPSTRPSATTPVNGVSSTEIIYDSYEDARTVLDAMDDIVNEYQAVSIAEMYELAGLDDRNYTDGNYGWTNLASARIVNGPQGGWTLKLPRVISLK